MTDRYEIVKTTTEAGPAWHARYVAGNGETVWATESYTRRHEAERAAERMKENETGDYPVVDVDETVADVD